MEIKRRALVAVFALVGAGCMAFGGSIRQAQLKWRELPNNWQLIEEPQLEPQQREGFERRLKANIVNITNQHFRADGQPLWINYIELSSERELEKALGNMLLLTGKTNGIVKKGNVAIEIVTASLTTKKETVKRLKLSGIQSIKLIGGGFPGNWKVNREKSLRGDDFIAKEEELGFRLKESLTQNVTVDARTPLVVKYFEPLDIKERDMLLESVKAGAGARTEVLQLGAISITVSSPNARLRKEAVIWLKMSNNM